jgi:hypothetical protein
MNYREMQDNQNIDESNQGNVTPQQIPNNMNPNSGWICPYCVPYNAGQQPMQPGQPMQPMQPMHPMQPGQPMQPMQPGQYMWSEYGDDSVESIGRRYYPYRRRRFRPYYYNRYYYPYYSRYLSYPWDYDGYGYMGFYDFY